MQELISFDYDGQSISFEFLDGNKMINATQMAKPFNKKVNDFLRLRASQDYILLLESRYGNSRNGPDMQGREVLRVVKGGEVNAYHEDILKEVIRSTLAD